MKFLLFNIELKSNKSINSSKILGKNCKNWINTIENLKGYRLTGYEINKYTEIYDNFVNNFTKKVILNKNGDIIANDKKFGLEWDFNPDTIETEDVDIYIRQHKINNAVKKIENNNDNNL